MKRLFSIIRFLFFVSAINAEIVWFDSLHIETKFETLVASNKKIQPLWSYSNQWGLYTQFKQTEALAYAKATYQICQSKYFNAEVGLALVGKTEFDKSMIHEAYIAGKAYIFDYTIGMQAYSPLAKYDELTSGNFLMSSNARPTPRVGIGLFDYWSIPYTRDWLQIKGALYIGKLFNEYDADDIIKRQYTKDVVFHEKFAYGRLGGWYVKPYFGLVHSVMMGGTLPDGTKLDIDLWASFIGKGSEKFRDTQFRGEATNAAGAHQGLWDLGFDFDFDKIDGTIYCKRPFADGTGKKYFDTRSKDFFLGVIINFKKLKYLKIIGLELTKTNWQGGEGNPDPIGFDDYGNKLLLYPGDLPEDNSQELIDWFYKHFNADKIEKWHTETGNYPYIDKEEAYNFFSHYWNNDWYFGGRSNCLSNGMYNQGWNVNGYSMSGAYFHSQEKVEAYANNNYSWQHLTAFPNYRVIGITYTQKGNFTDNIDYTLKFGYTKNQGNLIEKYQGGAYSWKLANNYFFDKSKKECYSMISFNYKNRNFKYSSSLAYDSGDLYNSFGIKLGITYFIK